MSICFSSDFLIPINYESLSSSIKDFHYDMFIDLLSIDKIKKFSEDSKQKQLDIKGTKKEIKFPKKIFLCIMRSVFGYSDIFNPIYELIFNRFKVIKCELKCPNHRGENYFISKIIPEDEIDIYEISCALAVFVKCDFNEKLHLLFDLTDVDDDGYINQNEVKKIIYTLNYMFAREETQLNIKSTVLNQSMASIRSQDSYKMVMKYPGELSKIILEEKYITFDQFITAVQKVAAYKYNIIPCFINFKDCLLTKRSEEEIQVKQKIFNDYAIISNDIISAIKNSHDENNGKAKGERDFKKYLETRENDVDRKRVNSRMDHKYTKRNKYRIKTKQSMDIIESCILRRNNALSKEDTFEVGYNKINNLETYPGCVKITDYMKTESSSMLNEKLPMIYKNLSLIGKKNIPSNYMTFNEIIAEINLLSKKHMNEELGTEILIEIENKINASSAKMKHFLRDPNPFQNLVLGRFGKQMKK